MGLVKTKNEVKVQASQSRQMSSESVVQPEKDAALAAMRKAKSGMDRPL